LGEYEALFSMTMAGDLLAVDPLAFQHHPARIIFGILCLLLALVLTLWKVLGPKVHKSRRERAFGAPLRILWGLMFPSYKGGASSARNADLTSAAPASHKKGATAIGGWLFLSEDAIEFYPHKMNIKAENIPILLDDILNVETQGNQLKIQTKTGSAYTFVVNKSKLWKQSITEIL
jgi:hypothetical protein